MRFLPRSAPVAWFSFLSVALKGAIAFLCLYAVCTFVTDFGVALAQGTEIPSAVPDSPLDMTGQLTLFLVHLVTRFPWLLTVIGLIGFLRVVFKPSMALLHGYVATTEDTADDQLLDRVEHSRAFAVLSWIIDLVGSVKVDTLKRVAAQRKSSGGGITSALALALAVTALHGCASTPEGRAFQTIASVQATVKTSLDAWADHVIQRRAEIAKLPAAEQLGPRSELLKQEGKVVAALGDYQRAMEAAEKGVNKALDEGEAPAPAALISAGAAFSAVVESLLH